MPAQEKTASVDTRWAAKDKEDLICLSHLRWNFVFQRPQHLMSRFARERRVFFIEEPLLTEDGDARLEVEAVTVSADDMAYVWVVVPHLPSALPREKHPETVSRLLDQLMVDFEIQSYALWYYTPEALKFSRHLKPVATIYDCMDELTLFRGANPGLYDLEVELLSRADVVFTGGYSLYEAKRSRHHNIHCFPSSIDRDHFEQARSPLPDPSDQQDIPHPRLGFFGVLDERLDLQLLAGIADARPDWHLVLVGPVVKIEQAQLPNNPNIHYLGMKTYQELPGYLAGWDVALLPFALNDSTRFISPTKTPEYLAGGKPVVSTPIPDVVKPYGEEQLVQIAGTVDEFVQAIERALAGHTTDEMARKRDASLNQMSWNNTWHDMSRLIDAVSSKVEN